MTNWETKNNFYKNLYLCVLSLIAIIGFSFSISNLPKENFNAQFFVLAFVTIFFSSYIRIQLPRTKIHLSFSEVVVIYILLTHGSGGAVIIAACEALITSYNLRRKGITIKNKTVLFNFLTGSNSIFLTALVINAFFFQSAITVTEKLTGEFIIILLTTGVILFLCNSIFVSIFSALKTEKAARTFWELWFNYCVNALVIYIASALLAGLAVKAQDQVNTPLFLLAVAVSGVVYFTYRRYVDDVRVTSAKAEEAERERAEQAEKHVGELQHYILEQDRISVALRESKEKFRHAAFHDKLTDLPNRNLFVETLHFALEKSRHKSGFKFAVLFLDINRFKTINDSLGHSIGDKLILNVAKRLVTSVRENDLVARFGGDEFAFILNNISNIQDAINFAERIKDKISSPFTLNGRQVFVSFSIGIAMGGSEYEAAEDVLRDADIAMYHAKETKQDYVVFDHNMHARAVTLLQLETDLRVALEREELTMFYQPIINIHSMKLFGFESLVRWNHPQRGLVPPGEFIPVSEDTGLIIPMTLWILRTSCLQMVEWQNSSPDNKNLVISVNISGKHFAEKNLVEQIKKILVETKINPACLKLELTESAVMENAENVIEMLSQIRSLGIKLSIDDFGTGYSSLSYLHRFPINTLKVDRSFVSTMADGTENGEIVRTVIALAKTLKLDVIAEGIETIHQLHQLRILGCEYGQGYLFSRPVSAADAGKIVTDQLRWENIIPKSSFVPAMQHPEFTHLRLAK